MNIQNNFTSICQIQDTYFPNQVSLSGGNEKKTKTFGEILQKTEETLKFSRHADERLSDRNISLTKEQLERLQKGADKAREKGIQESLVIMDNLSFIVNTKNSTVITAMEQTEKKENVYTNIDGAVII